MDKCTNNSQACTLFYYIDLVSEEMRMTISKSDGRRKEGGREGGTASERENQMLIYRSESFS